MSNIKVQCFNRFEMAFTMLAEDNNNINYGEVTGMITILFYSDMITVEEFIYLNKAAEVIFLSVE